MSSRAVTAAAGRPPTLNGDALWPDSLVMDVGVDSGGARAHARTVNVRLLAVDRAGADIDSEYGHRHAPATGVTKLAGTVDHPAVTTDGDGHSKIVLHPSTISGPVVIIATAANADSVVDTLRIGVPGLVSLTPGSTADLVGGTAIHPSSHWVRQEMWTLLLQFADSLHAMTDSVTHFNDASLPFGGKFDLDRQFSSPDAACVFRKAGEPPRQLPDGCHSRHRIGLDNDVRSRGFAADKAHLQDVMDLWEAISGTRPVHEADHLHFAYRP